MKLSSDMELLKTVEVSKMLRVGCQHVRTLIANGTLPGYREGRKGGYRTLRGHVEKYIADRIDKHGNE